MGIYYWFIGKGVFLLLEYLIGQFHGILWNATDEDIMDRKFDLLVKLSEHLEALSDRPIQCVAVGHDALNEDYCALTYDDEYNKTLEHLKQFNSRENLVFIGLYEEISDSEMSWKVLVPEVIYSMPTFLPHMLDCYNKFNLVDLDWLEKKFGQKPLIWTFTTDCHCCG